MRAAAGLLALWTAACLAPAPAGAQTTLAPTTAPPTIVPQQQGWTRAATTADRTVYGCEGLTYDSMLSHGGDRHFYDDYLGDVWATPP